MEVIEKTCFKYFLQLSTLDFDPDLGFWQCMSAMEIFFYSLNANSYCTKTNKFYIVFGLEDVLYITGLSINDNFVTGSDIVDHNVVVTLYVVKL